MSERVDFEHVFSMMVDRALEKPEAIKAWRRARGESPREQFAKFLKSAKPYTWFTVTQLSNQIGSGYSLTHGLVHRELLAGRLRKRRKLGVNGIKYEFSVKP